MVISTKWKIKQRCGSMHVRVWRKFVNLNRVVSAKKLPVEVIQNLYPFTEKPAWDQKWYLHLKAEIWSKELDMWVMLPRQSPCKQLSWCFPLEYFVVHCEPVPLEQDCHTQDINATQACLRLGEVSAAIWNTLGDRALSNWASPALGGSCHAQPTVLWNCLLCQKSPFSYSTKSWESKN